MTVQFGRTVPISGIFSLKKVPFYNGATSGAPTETAAQAR